MKQRGDPKKRYCWGKTLPRLNVNDSRPCCGTLAELGLPRRVVTPVLGFNVEFELRKTDMNSITTDWEFLNFRALSQHESVAFTLSVPWYPYGQIMFNRDIKGTF